MSFKLAEDQAELSPAQKQFISSKLRRPVQQVFTIRQVHGKRIVKVGADQVHPRPLLEADGMVTKAVNVPLSVRTADCLSIFIFDPKEKGIGLVHAGWKGTEQKIVIEAIRRMREEWKTEAKDLKVAFGPSIRKCCYEVGEEFFEYFPAEIVKIDGKNFLDLPLVNKKQLLNTGVQEKNIFDCGACTFCDTKYFSFRRDGEAAGRMISLMMLKE